MRLLMLWSNDPKAASRLDLDLRKAIFNGDLDDPELYLFQNFLRSNTRLQDKAPYLVGADWGGRFDLLFTNGRGLWVPVELKKRPEITASGNRRRNQKTKLKTKRQKLVNQIELATEFCFKYLDGRVVGFAVWWTGYDFQLEHKVVLGSLP